MLVGGEGGGFIWMGIKWLPLIDGFELPTILARSRDLQERGIPLFEKGSVPQRPKKKGAEVLRADMVCDFGVFLDSTSSVSPLVGNTGHLSHPWWWVISSFSTTY